MVGVEEARGSIFIQYLIMVYLEPARVVTGAFHAPQKDSAAQASLRIARPRP